jgi:nudix-type nucleoside diphosphatase (YffH/AdpP family)
MTNLRNLNRRDLFQGKKGLLQRTEYEFLRKSGEWQQQDRDVYIIDDAAVIILYNPENGNIILTRQFRMPTFLNGNTDGMLLEACAGKLEGEDPKTCIIRETEEETGYIIPDATQIAEAYIGPGAITEKIYYFIAPYNPGMKQAAGGGLAHEGEQIEVVELHLDEAAAMLERQEIQDSKTIVLLQYLLLHRTKLFRS